MISRNPTVNFMFQMRTLERAGMSPRDVLILWAVKTNPGIMGRELAIKLGYASRSNIHKGVERFLERGFIVDHRKIAGPHTPNDFHITEAGNAFLDNLIPSE